MVLGSLAGDDTIFAITKSEHDSLVLTTELKKLI
jgi:arginine repressor